MGVSTKNYIEIKNKDGIFISVQPQPDAVTPAADILKKTQRALNGTMCVDFIANKNNLDLSWTLLNEAKFAAVKLTFGYQLFLTVKFGENAETDYYLDKINYTPMFINDELFAQDVTVSLIEV